MKKLIDVYALGNDLIIKVLETDDTIITYAVKLKRIIIRTIREV